MANQLAYMPSGGGANIVLNPYYGYSYYKPPYFGYFGGGGAAPAPGAAAPAAPAAAPASPTSTVSDLQVLIASIPIAQDGDVITAEYHNTVRAAFIAMANRLGLGIIAEEIVVSSAPRLAKVLDQKEWTPDDVGQVKKVKAEAIALHGWMEMDLPDGSRIKKMRVFAANDSAGTMKVFLRRQSVSNPSANDNLIRIDITNNDATTAKEGDVTLPDSTVSGSASAIEETRRVDRSKYKYLFIADLDPAVADKDAKITAVQVVLGK
jgi:hypothetical protein